MVLDEPKNNDIVKEIDKIQVFFDTLAFSYAENLTLDNQDDNFFFLNPTYNC